MKKALVNMSVLGVLLLGVAGCGSTTSDRALSGAALGAAGGAAIGGITGGNALGGALIGGAAGAAAGALTKDDDVYLGKPVWRR